MADPAVAIDGLEALQVARYVAPQVALDDPLVLSYDIEDLVQLLLGEVLGAHVGLQASLLDDKVRAGGTDAVNVTERVGYLLLSRDFYT